MICALAVILAAGLAGQVQLRGGEAAPVGPVVAVGPEGVSLGAVDGAASGGAVVIVGWDRVRTVTAEGELGARAAGFAEVSDRLWRARVRLCRGDSLAAEPIFEDLFRAHEGKQGPTAAVVAEGLLRCRLRRGALTAAVPAWLAVLDSVGDGSAERGGGGVSWLHGAWSREAGLATVVDPETGLVPGLPPLWLGWSGVEAYARGVSTGGTGAGESGTGGGGASRSGRSAALADLYAHAARFEVGMTTIMPGTGTSGRGDPGVALAFEMVAARTGDAKERAAARAALMRRLIAGGGPAPWIEGWCYAGIGASLVREEGEDDRRNGVIELLRVPAIFEKAQPYLSGVCLALAVVTMEGLGETDGAAVLRRELSDRYPGHPALEWEPIRRVPAVKSAGSGTKKDIKAGEAGAGTLPPPGPGAPGVVPESPLPQPKPGGQVQPPTR